MFDKRSEKLGTERSEIRELFECANAMRAEGREVYDFSIGNPTAPTPEKVTEELVRLLREEPSARLHGYTSAAGDMTVRRAVARQLQSASGVSMSEDLVFMTCGAAASLVIALTAVLERGEEVVVPAPYFPEYAVFTETAGGRLVPVKTDGRFHLDLGEMERAITERTRAVLLNSPNNPTGAVYGKEELRALGELLRKKGMGYGKPIFLLSDEPYRELVYDGAPPVSPLAVYENTVILYSFSKSLTLAGERVGYLAVSSRCAQKERLFAAMAGAARAHGYVCAPALFQRALASCLSEKCDLGQYRACRDLLHTSLSDMGYACTLPEGAFYLFVKAPRGDGKEFSERAKGFGLMLVPSDSFGIAGYVRISYCVPLAVAEGSLPAFRALLASYR